MNRRNKDISGFIILNILADIDGDFNAHEGGIIAKYVREAFPLGGNLENALDELSNTNPDDYPILFQKCAEDFYADSTDKERVQFIDFALQLVSADQSVDPDESWMINKLYQYWDL